MTESITWNLLSATIGPTLRTSCMLPMVCSCIPVKPATSIGVPVIRFGGISAARSVLARTRFKDAPVLINALRMWTSLIQAATYKGLLWSGCCTSISSSMKVMTLVVSKKALLAWASVVRQWVPEFERMDTSALVAAFLASSLNPSWLNRAQKAGLLWSAETAAGGNSSLLPISSSIFHAWITTVAIAFPLLCCGSRFRWTPCSWVRSRVLFVIFLWNILRRALQSLVLWCTYWW